MKIAIGQPVPDFTARASGGREIRLSDFRGQAVVLYFYPKDNTPGCTQEAQAFRDHYPALQNLGAVVLGVSRDSEASHERFKTKQQLPFELLADPEETLCQLFDVIKQKTMYGKSVRGIERSTFLIDRDGVLVREWRKVRVTGHVAAVLQAVAELAPAS